MILVIMMSSSCRCAVVDGRALPTVAARSHSLCGCCRWASCRGCCAEVDAGAGAAAASGASSSSSSPRGLGARAAVAHGVAVLAVVGDAVVEAGVGGGRELVAVGVGEVELGVVGAEGEGREGRCCCCCGCCGVSLGAAEGVGVEGGELGLGVDEAGAVADGEGCGVAGRGAEAAVVAVGDVEGQEPRGHGAVVAAAVEAEPAVRDVVDAPHGLFGEGVGGAPGVRVEGVADEGRVGLEPLAGDGLEGLGVPEEAAHVVGPEALPLLGDKREAVGVVVDVVVHLSDHQSTTMEGRGEGEQGDEVWSGLC